MKLSPDDDHLQLGENRCTPLRLPVLSGKGRGVHRGRCRVGEEEAEEGVFGPVAVVAVGGDGSGEEGAVASVGGFDEGDVGIVVNLVAGFGSDTDEGIVEGVEDEGGDGDALENACCGGAVVVVVRSLKAGVGGGDAVVEVAERT